MPANATPRLKPLAPGALDSFAHRGIVPPAVIQTLLGQRLPEHPGYFGKMVWILTMLELWLQAKKPAYRLN